MASSGIYYDRNTHHFVGITKDIMDSWKKIYCNVDIEKELEKMKLWLETPAGKSLIGTHTFITGWFCRRNPEIYEEDMSEFFNQNLKELFQGYLEELWKDRTHILEMNRRKH